MPGKFAPKTEYAKKLLDPRWQKLRLEVYQRDNFKCQCCGATDKTLNAHHVQYRGDAEGPWDYPASMIVTVCEDCHADEHAGWRERDEFLLGCAFMAGARTNTEVADVAHFLLSIGEAIQYPDSDVEGALFKQISQYIARQRARRSE